MGKTTLARRALEQTGLRRRMVTIDGEPLQAGEVLPSLLTLFGAIDLPETRAEQLADWRRLLTDLKADPGEETNLIGKQAHAEALARAAQRPAAEVREHMDALVTAGEVVKMPPNGYAHRKSVEAAGEVLAGSTATRWKRRSLLLTSQRV